MARKKVDREIEHMKARATLEREIVALLNAFLAHTGHRAWVEIRGEAFDPTRRVP